MKQLRIALTLPGEASLGAFEAGAVCALLIAVQKLNAQSKADAPPPVCVDVISGASSGALTAVLAARILLSGEDPVYPLRRAWVTEPTVESLRGHDGSAPLTLDRARQVARELLAAQLQDSSDVAARTEESPPAQRSSVTLEFALACLRGFTYEIARKDRDPIRATSHIDWARHEFRPGVELGFTEQWSSAVDSAIASASHPVAFPPAVLDRTAERPKYRERQVKDFPESGELWYVDGGLLDREPLGRCLQIAREADAEHARDGQSERLVLVMRPEPDLPVDADDSDWTDADARPPWTTTLARAFRLVSRHSLYEDLRRVEKTNQRVSWTNELVRVLEPAVSNDAGARRALEQLVRSIERDKDSLGRRRRNSDANGSTPTPAELLKRALHAATGLESKVRVDVGVISAQDPSELAGGKLFQFGGFLAERLRANDFLVGYEAMAVWLLRGLPKRGVEPKAATAALQAVSDRADDDPGLDGRARRRPPYVAAHADRRAARRAPRRRHRLAPRGRPATGLTPARGSGCAGRAGVRSSRAATPQPARNMLTE